MHNYDGRNIYEFMKKVQYVAMLTPARQRSPQHWEFTEQDWSRGLHSGSALGPLRRRPARVGVPGAAAANVTKAKAKITADLRNCMTDFFGFKDGSDV